MKPSDAAIEMDLLPDVSAVLIRAAYLNAPGDELGSGKFASPESSAALVANSFGLFADRPPFPSLPHAEELGWPPVSVQLEATVRFPWAGGRHPCLDVLIATETALIGVESKRFEPFRKKVPGTFSAAYLKAVWGQNMRRFEGLRDALRSASATFGKLDAVQLVKHAFALRTAVHSECWRGKRPVLYYIYAEPERWPDGDEIAPEVRFQHRDEIQRFAQVVEGDEVMFRYCSYKEWLGEWSRSAADLVREHADRVTARFDP